MHKLMPTDLQLRTALPLTPVVGGRKASFFAKELREMAWVRVADFVRDCYHVLFRFAQETPRGIQAQLDLILRGRNARGTFKETVKVELAHAGLLGQSREAELLRHVFCHPIGHPSQLESW